MIDNRNPISPHLQIYRWHISSLLSITHRITGVINLLALILMFLWLLAFSLGESNYEMIKIFLSSIFGKFTVLALTWSFLFQVLSEIRHLFMDLGYGFSLKTTKVTGLIVIFGSFVLTVSIYLLGK